MESLQDKLDTVVAAVRVVFVVVVAEEPARQTYFLAAVMVAENYIEDFEHIEGLYI